MSGWIYVVELAPTGWIKVGRTNRLGARLTAHIANAGFGGATVTRTFAVACAKVEAVEEAVLTALRGKSGAELVHGKETFTGATFAEVVRVADEIAGQTAVHGSPVEVLPRPYIGSLDDVVAAMQGEARVRTQVVLQRLTEQHPGYAGWHPKSLTKFLRGQGVQPRKLSGGSMHVVLDDLNKSMSRQNRAAA